MILKSSSNFAHFQKKVQLDSLNVSKVIDSKECGYLNALFESCCLETLFGSQRVNVSQTLLKSALQQFYRTFPLISCKLSCETSLLVRSYTCVPVKIERNFGIKFKRNCLQN